MNTRKGRLRPPFSLISFPHFCYPHAMLIGHHQAQTQLAAMLQSGRFPHAVLLHGPQGIGKRKLAELLATRLICGPAQPSAPAETDMFGNPVETGGNEGQGGPLAFDEASPLYAQLQAQSCPDYHILQPDEGKKSIGIKQVQNLLDVLLRSSDNARTVIVDSLEDLTTEAANTILKTLEEPRPGIYFILVAHQLSAALPTIRSRCRLLPLHTLTAQEVEKVLIDINEDRSLSIVAAGRPGAVVGAGAKARAEALLALQNGQKPAATTPISTILQHMATRPHPPSLQQAEAYFKLAQIQRDAADKNLPAALTTEVALKTYDKSQ